MGRVFDGTCRLCDEVYTGTGISSHVKGCLAEHADIAAIHHGLLVGMRADGVAGRFWLYAIVRPEAPLSVLDDYLREQWFSEEPETASAFEIEETHYLDAIPDELDDSDDLETMEVDIGAVLRPRMDLTYTFDPRHPTEVEITVFDPYPCPEQLIDADSEATVATVARNDAPERTCSTCDNLAARICALCAAKEAADHETELGPFACDDCAGRHEGPLEPLEDRPRAGLRPDLTPEPDEEEPSDADSEEGANTEEDTTTEKEA